MKQQKMTDYQPKYPKKALRGAAMTAAALVAIGGMAGCVRVKTPGIALKTEGMVAVTEPPEEVLITEGEVAIPEPTPTPTSMPLMTTGLPTLSPTPGH